VNDMTSRRGRPRKSFLTRKDAVESFEADEVLDSLASNDAAPPPSRPPMRPEMKAEDPRARAARRAAEIRGNIGSMDEGVDEFYIDPTDIPPGWSYEWKRHTVAGAEDPSYAVSLARKGWEPVPVDRLPHLMPASSKDQYVTRKGMILMERPAELTDEARNIEERRARLQVRNKEAQLGEARPGEFSRNNKDAPLAKVKKGWEAVPIPE